jgi:hypothetical protein
MLLDLLVEYGDSEETPIPVAVETSRGLLVVVLRTGKRQVFAINPMAAARYRDRHSVSRKKSDPGDALVLANILRTDMHVHRPLPRDSELGRAVAVLARAQQDALWSRQQLSTSSVCLRRRHERITAPTAQARPGFVSLGSNQPQPGNVPAHVVTVRLTREPVSASRPKPHGARAQYACVGGSVAACRMGAYHCPGGAGGPDRLSADPDRLSVTLLPGSPGTEARTAAVPGLPGRPVPTRL